VELFWQAVMSGVSIGSVYALVALGLVLLYRTTTILNFAHGDLGVLAAFLAFTMLNSLEIPYLVSALLSLLAAGVIGALLYLLLLRPARNQSPLGLLILTLGLAFVLNSFDAVVFGTDNKLLPAVMADRILRLGGVSFSLLSLLTAGLGLLLMLGLWLLLLYTRLGLALRAVAQRPEVARALGLPVRLVLTSAWGIATLLAAAAALLFAPTTLLQPSMMLGPLAKGFVAAVIGGMSSLPGAVLGGYALGVLEVLVGTYLSLEFGSSFAFLAVILVLVVRPRGLLGRSEVRRV